MSVSHAADSHLPERATLALHDFLIESVLPRYIQRGRAIDLGAGSGALAVRDCNYWAWMFWLWTLIGKATRLTSLSFA